MSVTAAIPRFIQPLRRERVLLWCVLASIALHTLVLVGLWWRVRPTPPDNALLVLTARLAPAAAAPPPVSPPSLPVSPPSHALVAPPPSTPRPVARWHTVVRTAPKAATENKPKAAPPIRAPSVPTPAVAANAAPSAPPVAPVPARAAPEAQLGAPTATVAKSAGAADERTLARYRLALMAAAGRYKRYPDSAVDKGWQGKVEVRMVIGADGRLAEASIKASSGHEILDHQAIDMLRKGKTLVPIPASLRGRKFSLDVPVIFKLNGPGS